MAGYEDLVPKKSTGGNNYADLVPEQKPRSYSMFGAQPDVLEEAKGYGETVKGLAAGVGETATGLGELIPGEVGKASAKGTQKLEEVGDPVSRTLGNILTPLPIAKLLKGGKLAQQAPELLTRGKQAYESAKTGAKAGAIYGLASPTGKEDTEERYTEKGLSAALSIPVGGVLGGAVGGFTAKPTMSAAEAARNYVRDFVKRGFKGGENIEALASSSDQVTKEIEKLTQELGSIKILKPEQITAQSEAAAQKRIDNLNQQLNEANGKVLSLAEQKASQLKTQGGAEGEKAAADVLQKAKNQIENARQRVAKITEQTQNRLNSAKAGISKLGEEKELTDIFDPIQKQSISRQKNFIESRNALDKDLRKAQQDVVKENETKGVKLENMPAYAEIDKVTRPFDPATAPTVTQTTDPGVLSFYKRIRDSVINRRYELTKEQADIAKGLGYSVQQEGEKFYRTFNSSFAAADDARRFVGEVFRNPPEGYGAVKGIKQQSMYDLLSKLQQEYVGATEQKALQKNWSDAARNLEQFETKAGRTLTEIEEGTSHTAKPAAELGNVFFTNRTGVQNLIDVTGDVNAVRKAAGEYLVNQFKGLNSGQIRTWLGQPKNRDWLSHPELFSIKSQANQSVNALESLERAQRATSKLSQAPVKVEGKRLPTTEAERIAQEKAAKVKTETQAPFETRASSTLKSAQETATAAEQAAKGRAPEIAREEKRALELKNFEAKQQADKLKAQLDAVKGEANAVFKTAQQSGAARKSYDELRRFGSVVDQAEQEAARTGVPATTYSYDKLISEMKRFLTEQAKQGTIPDNLLLQESRKIDQINSLLARDKKIELLKEELKVLGGQLGTANFKGALRTGAGILSR